MSNLDIIKKIVKRKQAAQIQCADGKMVIDLQTANLLVKVCKSSKVVKNCFVDTLGMNIQRYQMSKLILKCWNAVV